MDHYGNTLKFIVITEESMRSSTLCRSQTLVLTWKHSGVILACPWRLSSEQQETSSNLLEVPRALPTPGALGTASDRFEANIIQAFLEVHGEAD